MLMWMKMVHLYEEKNRTSYIQLLEYVKQEESDEMVEADGDELVGLMDVVDNDEDHQQDNEHPLEVDNSF